MPCSGLLPLGWHTPPPGAQTGLTETLQGLSDADDGRVEDRICRVYGDLSFVQGAWNREGLRSPVEVIRVRHDKKSGKQSTKIPECILFSLSYEH